MDSTTVPTNWQTSTRSGAAVDNRLSMKWSAALLARFATIWPRAWGETTKLASHDDLIAEWAKGIDGLSGEEIRHGIDHCRAHSTWPPSIAEFRTACRGGANAEQRAYAARAREDQEGFLDKLEQDAWPPVAYTHTDWRHDHLASVPCTYVLCMQDQVLTPHWQRIFAERFRCDETVHIDAAHQVQNTRPQALAEVLLALAAR